MGAFDEGNIVKEALKRDLTTSISESQPSFIPVINSAVDFCFTNVNKINKKSAEGAKKQNGNKCDKISSIMLLCTRHQMIKVSLIKYLSFQK